MLLGDDEHGRPLYEWRWKRDQKKSFRNYPQPLWLGDSSLTGRTIKARPKSQTTSRFSVVGKPSTQKRQQSQYEPAHVRTAAAPRLRIPRITKRDQSRRLHDLISIYANPDPCGRAKGLRRYGAADC